MVPEVGCAGSGGIALPEQPIKPMLTTQTIASDSRFIDASLLAKTLAYRRSPLLARSKRALPHAGEEPGSRCSARHAASTCSTTACICSSFANGDRTYDFSAQIGSPLRDVR